MNAKAIIDILSYLVGAAIENSYRKKMEKAAEKMISPPMMIIEETGPNPVYEEPSSQATAYQEEPCEPCSVKHLWSGKTFLIEARTASEESRKLHKIREAYREILAAEQHLAEKHPDLAAEARELRKRIESCALIGEECGEINPTEVDTLIQKIIPFIPRNYYFKDITSDEVEE